MRSAKQYLVGLCTAAMVLGSVAAGATANAASAGSAPFSDISGSSHASAISFLATAGVVNGVGGGLFDPSAPVTRAEMAKIVVNLAGKGNIAAALAQETPGFVDAAKIPSWAWGYVNVAQDMGIIQGFPSGKFHPNQPVSDVQVAAMLIRAIGDNQTGVVTGTWPGNYVAASFSLGVNNGVKSFIANLPATRAQVAQMGFNSATQVPVAVPVTVNNSTTWCVSSSCNNGTTPGALWTKGQIAGYQAFNGVVTGVSESNVTISSMGTKNWETTYQLSGISSLANLVGLNVSALVDPSGNVSYIALAPGASTTTNSGSLVTSLPNSWSAEAVTVNGATYSAKFLTTGPGYSALVLSNGTNVHVAQTVTDTAYTPSTNYYVNAPATGPSTDGAASVPAATYLAPGDSISYVLNGSSQATAVYDTHATIVAGIVTGTCTSSCGSMNSGGSGTVTVEYMPNAQGQTESGSHVITVQGYTNITLNGAASSLSALQNNDVVYVNVVGGSATNGVNPNGLGGSALMGDNNATAIAAYENSVTGTLTGVTTSGSNVTGLTVQPASGNAVTINTDGNFDSSNVMVNGSAQLNSYVQVLLGKSGNARAVILPTGNLVGTVGLVTGTGQVSMVGQATKDTITVSTASGSETLNVNGAWAGGTFSGYNYNYTNSPAIAIGDTVPTATVVQLNQDTAPSGDVWKVVAEGSSGAVIQPFDTTTNTYTGAPVAVTNGNAFHNGGGSLGFSSLVNGDTVSAFTYTNPNAANGLAATTYWLLVDQSR